MGLDKVSEVFSDALDLPPSERMRFVAERLGSDGAACERLMSLLDAHGQAVGFFGRLESALQPPAEMPPMAAPGEIVASRFRILRFLAAGSTGEVYEAHDRELGVVVALKILKPRLTGNVPGMERFRQEILIARRISHPNICRNYDIGWRTGEGGDQALFYTMELVDGETIAARLRREGAMPLGEILTAARQLGAALHAMHSAHVFHRDISSGNVMLSKDLQGGLRAVLMDFGLAVWLDPQNGGENGVRGGTLSYTAPEQIAGAPPSAASDIYSFGAVLYEAMTGQPPAHSADAAPARAGALRPGLPAHWDTTVMRCLEARPEDRFASAADVVRALDGRSRALARRWLIGAGAACALAGFGAWRFWPQSPRAPRSSVAVARFTAGDPALDWLASGIGARLLDTLTGIPGLRTAGAAVSDRALLSDFSELETRARVRALLRGELTRDGSGYRLHVHLTDLETRYDLWSQTFEVDDRSLERVNLPVAQAVIRTLEVPRGENAALGNGKPRTSNPEAYQAWLLGKWYASKRDRESLTEAVRSYRRSVELDPSFAEGFSGLAAALNLAAGKPLMPDAAMAAESTERARDALRLNPRLAEAQAVLGSNEQRFHWNWEAAETHFRTAIGLEPGSVTAHHWYANLLTLLGRQKEALREIAAARDLDPISPVLAVAEGAYLARAGRYSESIDRLSWIVRTYPDYVNGFAVLAEALEASGNFEQALRVLDQGQALAGDAGFLLAARGYCLGRLARYGQARDVLNELVRRESAGEAAPSEVAAVSSGLRDVEATLYWLSRGIDRHDLNLTLLMVDPVNAWLHGDPRLDALRRRMRLPGNN